MWNYFIWNGVSSLDYSIRCTDAPLVIPSRRLEMSEVAGRSGYVLSGDDSSNGYTKTITCQVLNTHYINEVLNWLRGSGKLIFSGELDKFYIASITDEISLSFLGKDFRKFNLKFNCQPFKHSVNYLNDTLLIDNPSSYTSTKPFEFIGKGDVNSSPIIKIKAKNNLTGSITMNVNGIATKITNIIDEINIDSLEYLVYLDNVNMTEKMEGDFPILNSDGELNSIYFTGSTNIEYVKIMPYWLYR